jgi:hypothetical protein
LKFAAAILVSHTLYNFPGEDSIAAALRDKIFHLRAFGCQTVQSRLGKSAG